MKKTSIGEAGAALATNGFASIYSYVFQDGEKPAILGGRPVRPSGSDPGVSWPMYDDSDMQMYLDAFTTPLRV